jgi:cob(I)alamin adenosyltransferase
VNTIEPPRAPPRRAAERAASLVLVLTGDGKGKTTSARGVALRSLARGWRVALVQFVKSGAWRTGEGEIARRLGITYPMTWGWIETDVVVAAIRTRPPHVNLVLTGRDAPAAIVEVADPVTEMANRKHAFERGVAAVRGIGF